MQKNKFSAGDSVLWAEHAKSSANKVRAKVIRRIDGSEVDEEVETMYALAVEGSEVPQHAFESELEAVGGHVHYNMATVIPTSLLTLEKAIKEQLKVAAEGCNDDSHNRMNKLCDDVDTMYAELHEALDLKPIMPGFPEFIMGSMVRDLGHNLPSVRSPAYKGHRHQLPPVPEPTRIQKYLDYWAQKTAPRYISYECHYCDTKLKTFRPAKGQSCDSFVTCPYCEESYFIDVTSRKVLTTADPSTYPNDVAQAILHLVRKTPEVEGVFQMVYGQKELMFFSAKGRFTGPMPDSPVFKGLLKNLCNSAVQPGQSFIYEAERHGDPR